jgi:hypothetical protein
MSGATLSGAGGANARSFGDDWEPRQAFGKRRPGLDAARYAHGARSVDSGVADMRRRIGASGSPLPARLPWAIGGAVIAGLSAVLWMDIFQVATTLARELTRVL